MSTDNVIQLKYADIYRKEKKILSDVNINVRAGEFYFLIGKVGSGKSSLLKTLYGELPLERGTCYVAGYNVNNMSPSQIPYLRRKIGIVFQDFQLLEDRSVYQNLKVVLKATGWNRKSKINKRIEEVLVEVGLFDKVNSMPHELSGGEQQRVVIARAILNKPPVILADEPTGNLDPDSSAMIMNIFKNIQENGSAVIMATHNYSLIKSMPSNIFKIENGSVLVEERAKEIDFSLLD